MPTRRTPARRPAARRSTSSSRSKVMVGRFGSEPTAVQFTGRNLSVYDALQKAGIELDSAERVWVNGERATLQTQVKNNDTISIVSPKEAGSF